MPEAAPAAPATPAAPAAPEAPAALPALSRGNTSHGTSSSGPLSPTVDVTDAASNGRVVAPSPFAYVAPLAAYSAVDHVVTAVEAVALDDAYADEPTAPSPSVPAATKASPIGEAELLWGGADEPTPAVTPAAMPAAPAAPRTPPSTVGTASPLRLPKTDLSRSTAGRSTAAPAVVVVEDAETPRVGNVRDLMKRFSYE